MMVETFNQFFDDLKKYFNITYETVGCSEEWIQSHVSDIAEMTETWYIHSDSKFVEEANGLLSYLNGYLHGMDDFNSYTSGDPDLYTETMRKCNTFDEFVEVFHKEVNGND